MLKTGLIKGPSHDNGGIGIEVKETGQTKEVEGDEYVICSRARFSEKIHEYVNKTNKEILDEIHQEYDCAAFNPKLSADDFIICKLSVKSDIKRDITGTVAEILNIIQAENGCVTVAKDKYLMAGGGPACGCDHDKKQGGPVNPWAVCTTAIGKTAGTTKRSLWDEVEKKKYEKCVLSVKDEMARGGPFLSGKEVEKEHTDLYNKIKGRLQAQGVEMPISKDEFFTTIANVHEKEVKNYYPLLQTYVEPQMAGGGPVNEKIDKAKQLGELAYTNGLTATPVHDPALMELIAGLKPGEGADKILKAWVDAWHRANKKANPIENFLPNTDAEIINKYPKLSKNAAAVVYNEVLKTLAHGAPYSESEKQDLERYEGRGSLVESGVIDEGMVHQFYTPYIVCKKMWDLAKHYGFNGGNILEPSSGTGRFFKFAPQGSTLYGFDLDETNIKIATALYPQATFYKQEFETAFLQPPNYSRAIKKSWLPEMDLVIGNPPYGDYEGYYKSYMPNTYKRFEFLFIRLGLQALKPGGLLIYIISQNLMNNGAMYNKMKKDILDIGTFVDAIRLPNGIFTSTQIGTDIIIFRKK